MTVAACVCVCVAVSVCLRPSAYVVVVVEDDVCDCDWESCIRFAAKSGDGCETAAAAMAAAVTEQERTCAGR